MLLEITSPPDPLFAGNISLVLHPLIHAKIRQGHHSFRHCPLLQSSLDPASNEDDLVETPRCLVSARKIVLGELALTEHMSSCSGPCRGY